MNVYVGSALYVSAILSMVLQCLAIYLVGVVSNFETTLVYLTGVYFGRVFLVLLRFYEDDVNNWYEE